MSFLRIILFSTLCGFIANSNVFSISIDQSFNTASTSYITRDYDVNTGIYQILDSRTTTEQIANANSKCNEYIITNNRHTVADIPNETRPAKTFIPYKRMRSQTINSNITIRQQSNLMQNIDEYNNTFKSAAQICNNNKLEQLEINSCSDIYSDSYSDDDIEHKCNNNTKILQDEKASRKSTGISPSQGSSSSENQNVNNKESSNKTTDDRNKKNSTPKKNELLTDTEKRTIKYIKDNVLNNKTKTNSNFNLYNVKQSNTKMQYLKYKTEQNINKLIENLQNNILEIKKRSKQNIINNLNKQAKPIYKEIIVLLSNINNNSAMASLYNANKTEIDHLNNLILQDIEDGNGFISKFISNTETMHGIYDQVYYNTKYTSLNETVNKLKSNKTLNDKKQEFLQFCSKQYAEPVLQSIVFNKLPVLLNNLLTEEFNYNKNNAIANYFDTCILNYNFSNNIKNINKENNPRNIVDYFYDIKLSNNNVIDINEIQNKFKNINLEYKNEHISNIIGIYEQWKDIYNKYNDLYKRLTESTLSN